MRDPDTLSGESRISTIESNHSSRSHVELWRQLQLDPTHHLEDLLWYARLFDERHHMGTAQSNHRLGKYSALRYTSSHTRQSRLSISNVSRNDNQQLHSDPSALLNLSASEPVEIRSALRIRHGEQLQFFEFHAQSTTCKWLLCDQSSQRHDHGHLHSVVFGLVR